MLKGSGMIVKQYKTFFTFNNAYKIAALGKYCMYVSVCWLFINLCVRRYSFFLSPFLSSFSITSSACQRSEYIFHVIFRLSNIFSSKGEERMLVLFIYSLLLLLLLSSCRLGIPTDSHLYSTAISLSF